MAPVAASYFYRYRRGKIIANGTYATVKEAEHISTCRLYACKIIDKKNMETEERKSMVQNEISALKKLSTGHRNIVTLHDYFETAQSLHLCFDLCTGGSLLDRISAKKKYYEEDAAALIRTIMSAVKHIHECGIIHRNIHPENLLFRTKEEDADIMIIGFGMSHIISDEKVIIKIVPATGEYMAPEIFKQSGYGKPVDVWAMGVLTYFLLSGSSPFHRDIKQEGMVAFLTGNYHFKPEHWTHLSVTARDFINACLTIDPASRPTAAEALKHKWLTPEQKHFAQSLTDESTNLVSHIEQAFDGRKVLRKAVFTMIAVKRMTSLAGFTPMAQTFDHNNLAPFEEDEEAMHGDQKVTHYDGNSSQN